MADLNDTGRPATAAPDSAQPDAAPPAIELRGISKAFGPVQANKDISIRVMPGTIHGIIGENGAGKSTLMSILYGFYKADSGEIFINGKKTPIPDSQAAIAAGIGMVFQHFKLVENFTVLENVILGVEGARLLKPSKARARGLLKQLAAEYELNVDPDALIEDLSVGHQQRVEILKALYREADILILDEPTGVLTPAEADHLFRILEGLRREGKTIILITHSVEEALLLGERLLVMAPRPGRIHKEYNLPFAERGVNADLREVKKSEGYASTREEILTMIWDMEEEIMGRTEPAS